MNQPARNPRSPGGPLHTDDSPNHIEPMTSSSSPRPSLPSALPSPTEDLSNSQSPSMFFPKESTPVDSEASLDRSQLATDGSAPPADRPDAEGAIKVNDSQALRPSQSSTTAVAPSPHSSPSPSSDRTSYSRSPHEQRYRTYNISYPPRQQYYVSSPLPPSPISRYRGPPPESLRAASRTRPSLTSESGSWRSSKVRQSPTPPKARVSGPVPSNENSTEGVVSRRSPEIMYDVPEEYVEYYVEGEWVYSSPPAF